MAVSFDCLNITITRTFYVNYTEAELKHEGELSKRKTHLLACFILIGKVIPQSTICVSN